MEKFDLFDKTNKELYLLHADIDQPSFKWEEGCYFVLGITELSGFEIGSNRGAGWFTCQKLDYPHYTVSGVYSGRKKETTWYLVPVQDIIRLESKPDVPISGQVYYYKTRYGFYNFGVSVHTRESVCTSNTNAHVEENIKFIQLIFGSILVDKSRLAK